MSSQERTSKVLICLVASMTVGAAILMALDNQSLAGGAFSLASYTRLDPIEKIVSTNLNLDRNNWDQIEVYFGEAGSDQLAAAIGLKSSAEVNSHFVVYNGRLGEDGFIQSTARWRNQQPCLYTGNLNSAQTIRVCVISEKPGNRCSDCQRQRTTALIENLSRKFNIPASRISYPTSWQM